LNQTRTQSFVEACLNTAVGWLIGLVCQVVVFPRVGIHATFRQNLLVSAIFTVVSVARGYAVRRWCNAYLHRLAARIVARSTPRGQRPSDLI